MRVKVTLTKNFDKKIGPNQPWASDSNTTIMKKNKAMAQEWHFVPKGVRKKSSHKILEKYNEQTL